MATIFGYCPSPNNTPIQTAKAVRVTVKVVDQDAVDADTVWLPRSIAKGLEIRRVDVDGCPTFEVRAEVPAWWAAKLDIRPRWQKRGEARPPMAQRPW